MNVQMRNWKPVITEVSDHIYSVEVDMQDNCYCAPAKYKNLSWERDSVSGRFRIMFNGKPLMEAKVADKIQNLKDLTGLVSAADVEMEKLSKEIEQ